MTEADSFVGGQSSSRMHDEQDQPMRTRAVELMFFAPDPITRLLENCAVREPGRARAEI